MGYDAACSQERSDRGRGGGAHGGGAGMGFERSRGRDLVGGGLPSHGLRIKHREEIEKFDENWSPWKKRAWQIKHRVGFHKFLLTLPEFVFNSEEDEQRLIAAANGSHNFRPTF